MKVDLAQQVAFFVHKIGVIYGSQSNELHFKISVS